MTARTGLRRRVVWVSIAASLATGGFLYWLWGASDAARCDAKIVAFVVWAGWSIVPPLWFLCEWCWLRPADGESLKYTQELAGKFWLAGITVISVAILGSFGGTDATFSHTCATTAASSPPAALAHPA